MMYDILDKRKHVVNYDLENYPSSDIVTDILQKAWKVTPSKNNFMPYNVNVLGPEHAVYKESIWNKVVGNHFRMEEIGEEQGHIKKASGKVNPYYEHIRYNPYLLVFSSRVCKEANPFYTKQIEKGHFAEQMYPEWVERIVDSTAIEVGLFAQNTAALCLEQDIDYSFTSCFPRDLKQWADIPFVEYRVLLLMTIGYGSYYRRQKAEKEGWSVHDYKPSFETVVNIL